MGWAEESQQWKKYSTILKGETCNIDNIWFGRDFEGGKAWPDFRLTLIFIYFYVDFKVENMKDD